MFRATLFALLVAAPPAAADDKADAVAAEWKALEGKTFRLTAFRVNGKTDPWPEKQDGVVTLTFKKGRVTLGDANQTEDAEMTLDPTTTPKQFTARFGPGAAPDPLVGVYEYKDGVFRAGVGKDNNPFARPDSLAKAQFVLEFTEQKPKK